MRSWLSLQAIEKLDKKQAGEVVFSGIIEQLKKLEEFSGTKVIRFEDRERGKNKNQAEIQTKTDFAEKMGDLVRCCALAADFLYNPDQLKVVTHQAKLCLMTFVEVDKDKLKTQRLNEVKASINEIVETHFDPQSPPLIYWAIRLGDADFFLYLLNNFSPALSSKDLNFEIPEGLYFDIITEIFRYSSVDFYNAVKETIEEEQRKKTYLWKGTGVPFINALQMQNVELAFHLINELSSDDYQRHLSYPGIYPVVSLFVGKKTSLYHHRGKRRFSAMMTTLMQSIDLESGLSRIEVVNRILIKNLKTMTIIGIEPKAKDAIHPFIQWLKFLEKNKSLPLCRIYIIDLYYLSSESKDNAVAKPLDSYLEMIIFFDQLIAQKTVSKFEASVLERLRGFFINQLKSIIETNNQLAHLQLYCKLRGYDSYPIIQSLFQNEAGIEIQRPIIFNYQEEFEIDFTNPVNFIRSLHQLVQNRQFEENDKKEKRCSKDEMAFEILEQLKKYRLLNEGRGLRELEDNINLVCYPENHLEETQPKLLIFLAIDLQSVELFKFLLEFNPCLKNITSYFLERCDSIETYRKFSEIFNELSNQHGNDYCLDECNLEDGRIPLTVLLSRPTVNIPLLKYYINHLDSGYYESQLHLQGRDYAHPPLMLALCHLKTISLVDLVSEKYSLSAIFNMAIEFVLKEDSNRDLVQLLQKMLSRAQLSTLISNSFEAGIEHYYNLERKKDPEKFFQYKEKILGSKATLIMQNGSRSFALLSIEETALQFIQYFYSAQNEISFGKKKSSIKKSIFQKVKGGVKSTIATLIDQLATPWTVETAELRLRHILEFYFVLCTFADNTGDHAPRESEKEICTQMSQGYLYFFDDLSPQQSQRLYELLNDNGYLLLAGADVLLDRLKPPALYEEKESDVELKTIKMQEKVEEKKPSKKVKIKKSKPKKKKITKNNQSENLVNLPLCSTVPEKKAYEEEQKQEAIGQQGFIHKLRNIERELHQLRSFENNEFLEKQIVLFKSIIERVKALVSVDKDENDNKASPTSRDFSTNLWDQLVHQWNCAVSTFAEEIKSTDVKLCEELCCCHMPNEINFEADYHNRQAIFELFSEIKKVEIAEVGSRIFTRKFPPLKKADNDYVLYLDPNLMKNFDEKVTEIANQLKAKNIKHTVKRGQLLAQNGKPFMYAKICVHFDQGNAETLEVDLTITTAAPQQDLKPRWLNLGAERISDKGGWALPPNGYNEIFASEPVKIRFTVPFGDIVAAPLFMTLNRLGYCFRMFAKVFSLPIEVELPPEWLAYQNDEKNRETVSKAIRAALCKVNCSSMGMLNYLRQTGFCDLSTLTVEEEADSEALRKALCELFRPSACSTVSFFGSKEHSYSSDTNSENERKIERKVNFEKS